MPWEVIVGDVVDALSITGNVLNSYFFLPTTYANISGFYELHNSDYSAIQLLFPCTPVHGVLNRTGSISVAIPSVCPCNINHSIDRIKAVTARENFYAQLHLQTRYACTKIEYYTDIIDYLIVAADCQEEAVNQAAVVCQDTAMVCATRPFVVCDITPISNPSDGGVLSNVFQRDKVFGHLSFAHVY